MKLALSTTTLRSHPPGEVVAAAARMGYGAVEIWAEHLWAAGTDPAALGNEAREKGLEVSLHGPSRDLNVTSSNAGIRRESRLQYQKSLEDAARMGARIVNLHPGALSGSRDDPEDFTRRMIDYGASLAEEAGRLGLTVALEIMERRKREFVTDIPAAARIARGVDSPSFGLTVDLAHLLYSGAPVEIEGHESIIFHVHISGSTRERVHVPLAEGIYDLKDALARLRPFFRGIVVVESYAREREMQAAGDNKREFDQLMREIDTAPPGR